MSPKSLSPLIKVSSFMGRADFQLTTGQRRELLRPGSLSSRLQRWCDGALPVAVVRQGHCLPTPDEARALGMRAREQVWVREVRLGPPQQPWIQARTVSPLRDMQGPGHCLRNLGSRPLGSVLFSSHGWRRGPFLVGRMLAADFPGTLPARRSVFHHSEHHGNSRLLVTEGFYPAYWQRRQQEQLHHQAPAGAAP